MQDLTENDVYRALTHLGETDEEFARTKASVEFVKHKSKTAYAVAFMEAQGNTVRDREAHAETSKGYQQAMQAHRDAVYDHEIIKAKRMRSALIIDCWRSINSARSKGTLV